MNKLRLLIVSEQNEFDKKLSNKIKKFSSERNLFFANLYNSSLNMTNGGSNNNLNNNSNHNGGEKIEKNTCKSFFRNTLLKRCKSSKDVYVSATSSVALTDESEKTAAEIKRQSFNLDEFDRKYLFSQNRKNIVKELRKNFENQVEGVNNSPPPPSVTSIAAKPPLKNVQKIPTPFKKCEFSATDIEKRLSLREKPITGGPPKRIVTRHSFYLNRNEYSDIYEVGGADDCDNCNSERVKNKARQLIQMFGRNDLPLQPPLKPHRRNSSVIVDEGGFTSLGVDNLDYKNHLEANNNRKNNNSNSKTNLDNILITRNDLMASTHLHPKRRSLSAAIARDNNLYRNLLSDSFEDSKYGIKKSGSVNKIDLEILKNELDDYVDPKWRANINLGYGFRSQRTLRSNRKELDLEQKIDLEIKMREGSAKLLAACKLGSSGTLSNGNGVTNPHSTQMLEAAKNLLTSNERMTAYMAELQRRKRDRDTIAKAKPHGKISLSEIRMPLMWRDTDHFKNKGDHRRFAVFCLAKIGTEIYDTSLLCPVDRNLTDVCFNDAILFTNVTPDFSLKLEVYAVMMEQDLSIASTPRKIKNTIHSSISRTVGRRLAANLKDELNNTKIGPKFELIATAHLSLEDASELTHTHDLCLSPNNATTVNVNSKLPLFGHFCCRLAVQPDFYEQASQAGPLCMLPKGPARQVEGYARLQAFRLDLWDDEKAFKAGYQPRRSVEITRETKCKLKDSDIVLANLEEGTIEEYYFRSTSHQEAQKWYSALKKAIKEHIQWSHVTTQSAEPMQLAIPGNSKSFLTRNPRQGSLYDQVPILESLDNRQSAIVTTARPSVHDIFAVPASVTSKSKNLNQPGENGDTSPTLNDFRSRSYSSGRSSSHSSTLSASSIGSISSRKSHWPFGIK